MTDAPAQSISSRPGGSTGAAITTPFWDGFLTGGLSLIGMAAVLAYRLAGGQVNFDEQEWFALTILINSPHFMASYRVLYSSAEQVRRHAWATLVVPAGLLAAVAWVGLAAQPDGLLGVLVLISSVYLAWHYSGQTWGMVATFSRLADVSYTDRERLCLRLGPRSLLVLHVILALYGRLPPAEWISAATWGAIYSGALYLSCGVAVLSVGTGAWAFHRARARTGRLPVRAVLPWASYFLWYPFWILVPGGFFWLQLSHALQYLAFPLRVDLNRQAERAQMGPGRRRIHVAWTYLALVAVGAVVLHGPPLAAHAFGEGWYSTSEARRVFLAVTHCVAIHHYFVDGAIWHLRDASVRRPLFAHLSR